MGSAPESREGHEASLPTLAVSSMLPKSHGVQIFPLSGLLPADQTAGVQDRGLREAHWMRPRAYRHRLGDPSCWLLNPLPRLKPPSFDLGLGGSVASPPRSRKVTTTQPADCRSPQINAKKHRRADTLEQRERRFWSPPGPQVGPWALTGTRVLWVGPCLTASRGLYSCRRRGRPESGLIKLHTPGMDRTAGPQPQGHGSGAGGWSAVARRPRMAPQRSAARPAVRLESPIWPSSTSVTANIPEMRTWACLDGRNRNFVPQDFQPNFRGCMQPQEHLLCLEAGCPRLWDGVQFPGS